MFLMLAAIVLSAALSASAQAKPAAGAIFRDSDGNLITNNEFVDIRMANFHMPDRTLMRMLDDGTVEFRLQKIPQEDALAPDFTAAELGGKEFKLADYKGKVVVLNFWFIGCPACVYETPRLNELKAKFANEPNVEFAALAPDSEYAIKKYAVHNPFTYRQLVDGRAQLALFVVGGFPKNIVIGKDGRIVYWRSTVKAMDKFESVIRAELAK